MSTLSVINDLTKFLKSSTKQIFGFDKSIFAMYEIANFDQHFLINL